MSRLEFYGRPLVAFDPSKKEHRDIFHRFTVSNGWGHSPYRFICPEDRAGHDLPTMMQKSLIEWYLDREFGKPVAVETARKDVQKIKKMVDKQKK